MKEWIVLVCALKRKRPLGVHEVIVFCAGSGRGLWQWRQPAGTFSVWKELKLPLGQNGVKWVGVLWHVSLGKGRGGRFSTKTSSTTTRKNANARQKRLSLECTSRKCVMTKINRFVHGSRKRTSHLVSVIWLLLCVCDNYAFIICKLFSTDVFSLLKNDKSSWTRLVRLKQTLRQLIVHSSSLCTPADDGHRVKKKSNPLMTNFFSPTSSPNQPTKPNGLRSVTWILLPLWNCHILLLLSSIPTNI